MAAECMSTQTLSLSNPVRNGVVESWDDLELIWEHIWETEGRNADNGNAG